MSQDKIIASDILLEFLEVAFHNILYYRKLYPAAIFAKKRIYGTTIHVSQHPDVNRYITNVLACVQDLIQQDENCLKSVNLLFLNKDQTPIEKFTFRLDQLRNNITGDDTYFMIIEETLRALCLKLSMCETYLDPLPTDSSFVIKIAVNQAAEAFLIENSKYNNFPWCADDNTAEVQRGLLLPIKDLNTAGLVLQCYAVEDKECKADSK